MEFEYDDEGNILDPITNLPIPMDRVLTIKDGKARTYMDVHTLLEHVVTSGKYTNPLTTNPLKPDLVDFLDKYRKAKSIKVIVTDENKSRSHKLRTLTLSIDFFFMIGDIIVEVARALGSLDAVTRIVLRIDNEGSDAITLYELPLASPLTELADKGIIRLRIIKGRHPTTQEIELLNNFTSSYSRHETVTKIISSDSETNSFLYYMIVTAFEMTTF